MCGSCARGRWMIFVGNVQTAVKNALDKVLTAIPPADLGGRKGGYFCLKALGAEAFLIKPMLVGEVTNGKDQKYIEFCQEKANRLEEEHAVNGHVSSFQSQDPEHDKWPGAILGPDGQKRQYAFSFSGLPWMCDEAITLLTAIEVGHLTKEEAIDIAELSDNHAFFEAAGFDRRPYEGDLAEQCSR